MSEATNLSINIKGPETKLTLSISPNSTVLELKAQIFENASNFPVAQQRLIYSGRVLKDEDQVSKYALKDSHTIHLVKGAAPATSQDVGSASSQVPTNFAAGQQIAGNPLAPLLAAQNAGALAGFNPFAQLGINSNDPNYMQNMMNDPSVQSNMANMLNDPAVIDQVIASNPELRAMGPQVRTLLQSPQFRAMLSDPNAMRSMMQMAGSRGAPGMGGMGGMFGGQQAATTSASPPAPGAPTNLFNPWAANAPTATGTDAAVAGAFNPFAMGGAGGTAGGAPDFAALMQMQQQLQAMGYTPPGMAPPAPTGPVVPPEERYQVQLEQLVSMGFYDPRQNIQALQASGGNVEMAVDYLFSHPQ